MDKWGIISILIIIVFVLFLTSKFLGNNISGYTINKKYENPSSPVYIPPSTYKPDINNPQNDYEMQVAKASKEAVSYCNRNPYGTYRTTVYKNGIAIPITVEC